MRVSGGVCSTGWPAQVEAAQGELFASVEQPRTSGIGARAAAGRMVQTQKGWGSSDGPVVRAGRRTL